jgi:hypothetical protein
MKTKPKFLTTRCSPLPVPCSPATAAVSDCSQPLPEFGRADDVRRIFGLKRGHLYKLIADGKVRSVSLREPGCARGARLIHLASVRDFLLSHQEAA